MSATCLSLRPSNDGITSPPLITWRAIASWLGLRSSRLGPIAPVAPAAFRVWQLPQFDALKTTAPATGSPCSFWSAVGLVVAGFVVAGFVVVLGVVVLGVVVLGVVVEVVGGVAAVVVEELVSL